MAALPVLLRLEGLDGVRAVLRAVRRFTDHAEFGHREVAASEESTRLVADVHLAERSGNAVPMHDHRGSGLQSGLRRASTRPSATRAGTRAATTPASASTGDRRSDVTSPVRRARIRDGHRGRRERWRRQSATVLARRRHGPALKAREVRGGSVATSWPQEVIEVGRRQPCPAATVIHARAVGRYGQAVQRAARWPWLRAKARRRRAGERRPCPRSAARRSGEASRQSRRGAEDTAPQAAPSCRIGRGA
jgi:hypothetical protein